MRFSGIDEPKWNVPLIDFDTPDGRVVDLYNEHRLRSSTIRRDELVFEFAHLVSEATAVLQFSQVRNLQIVQPPDWELGEAEQIEYVLLRRPGPPRVVFVAGGLVYEFDSVELRLTVQPAER